MKHFLQTLPISMLMLFFSDIVSGQPNFTAYTGNPVIGKGLAGSWDDYAVWAPCVSLINDTFYTTYLGIADPTVPVAIGLATSTDGFNYVKSNSNPILWSDSTGFDALSVDSGLLYYNSGNWYLYYSGRDTFSFQPGKVISFATATNPHGPWNRTDDTLLTIGSLGEWDDGNIAPLSIIVDGDNMYLYYWGGPDWDISPTTNQIGLAISHDSAQTWVKWDDPLSTNPPFSESDPVIKLGPETYDDFMISGAGIIKNGLQWEMLYNGSTYPFSGAICYATSTEGIHWYKHANNPIFTYLNDPWAINGYLQGATVSNYNDQRPVFLIL
jgi:hypothetical protein